MKKGYFAVWFDPNDGLDGFNATAVYPTASALKKKVNFFEDPLAVGHVVIFYSNGRVFYPVEETWMPLTNPGLNWRGYVEPE